MIDVMVLRGIGVTVLVSVFVEAIPVGVIVLLSLVGDKTESVLAPLILLHPLMKSRTRITRIGHLFIFLVIFFTKTFWDLLIY